VKLVDKKVIDGIDQYPVTDDVRGSKQEGLSFREKRRA